MKRQMFKTLFENQAQVIYRWKLAYERQEKLLRRALLVIKPSEDKELMADILAEINNDTI